MAEETLANGRVVRVIGPVVDVEFPPDELPEINTALPDRRSRSRATTRASPARWRSTSAEGLVRAIALKPTDGLVRGSPVENTGSPIRVPVGEGVLGHVYNVLGEPLDTSPDKIHAADRWPIHREPPPFEDLEPQAGDARDRHQGDRPARAVRAGRQDRDVRRRRRGQDRDHPGDDPPPGAAARRRVGVRGRRRADARGQRPVAGDESEVGDGQHDRPDGAGVRADGRAAGGRGCAWRCRR